MSHHGPDILNLQQLTLELSANFDVTVRSGAYLRALLSAVGTASFRNQFSLAQVRAVLGVLQRVLEADMAAWQRGSTESLAYFQAELLALSVERPPHSEGLLNPVQATAALDFVLKAYYQHFTLYKTVCAKLPALSLVTRNTCEVDAPLQPPPLAEATQI